MKRRSISIVAGLDSRPLVVVGGELTLENADLTWSESAKFYEAPFQMKSNGGTLVIDDFGRQRVARAGSFEPLDRNRWNDASIIWRCTPERRLKFHSSNWLCFRPTSMKRISPTRLSCDAWVIGARRATNTRSLHRDLQASKPAVVASLSISQCWTTS